jgi:malate dehydrogenase (quinone)
MHPRILTTDILTIGGGVSGTGFQNVNQFLRRRDGTGSVSSILVERLPEVGALNSHHTQNSQTLHEGDIESNYTPDKSQEVHDAAAYTRTYLKKQEAQGNILYRTVGKMLLGVGQQEVDIVSKRYHDLTITKKLFPDNKLLTRDAIAHIEPALVDGRDPTVPLAAYYSPDGMAVDFGKVAQSMARDTLANRPDEAKILTGRKVVEVIREDTSGQLFRTLLDDGTIILSKAVVVNAGPYTPVLMKALGYNADKGVLSIAGNYYRVKTSARLKITNKVYGVQEEGLPNAALHLDPEVDDPNLVRLGPTAFGIPYLEKKNRTSFFDYMGIINTKHDLQAFVTIMKNPTIRNYVFKNFKFLIPIYGKWLFLQDAKKLIPSLKRDDIEILDGYGGTRPQSINRQTHALDFGESKVIGKHENVIGNTTPSPGASTFIKNALVDNLLIADMPYFKEHFIRDQAGFDAAFAPQKTTFVPSAVPERAYQAPTQAPLSYEQLSSLELQGKNCKLRAVTQEDAESIFNNANDPSIYGKRLTRQKKGSYELEDAQQFVDYTMQEHQKNHKRILGIEVDGEIVGMMSLTRNEFPYDHTAYTGTWVGTAHRGKWLAQEAMQLMCDNARLIFPDLIRLEARIFEGNEVVPHILEKVGFHKEATLQNRIVHQGLIKDEFIYTKLLC